MPSLKIVVIQTFYTNIVGLCKLKKKKNQHTNQGAESRLRPLEKPAYNKHITALDAPNALLLSTFPFGVPPSCPVASWETQTLSA